MVLVHDTLSHCALEDVYEFLTVFNLQSGLNIAFSYVTMEKLEK